MSLEWKDALILTLGLYVTQRFTTGTPVVSGIILSALCRALAAIMSVWGEAVWVAGFLG